MATMSSTSRLYDVTELNGSTFSSGIHKELEYSIRFRAGLPKSIAYLDDGVEKWAAACHHPDYYQTREELLLVERLSVHLTDYVMPNAKLLDFGAGDGSKMIPLLQAIDQKGVECSYFCLDISQKQLMRTINALRELRLNHVQVFGLWGDYKAGIQFMMDQLEQRVLIFLGSTLPDVNKIPSEDSTNLLTSLAGAIRHNSSDYMISGHDCYTGLEKSKIEAAYHHEAFEHFFQAAVSRIDAVLGLEPTRNRWSWTCSLETGQSCTHHRWKMQLEEDIMVQGALVPKGKTYQFFDSEKPTLEHLTTTLSKWFRIQIWNDPPNKSRM